MSLNFKRNYPIILFLVIALAFFTFVIGNQRVIAYTVQSRNQQNEQVITRSNITNDRALLDDSVVHSIKVVMSDEDYNKMITTYQETGLKEYFQVDIIIDGVQINDVGIRLKGNASLRAALGGSGGMGGGNRNGGQGMFNNQQPPDNMGKPGNLNGEMPEVMSNDQVPAYGEMFEPQADAQMPTDRGMVGPQNNLQAPADGEMPGPGNNPQVPANGEMTELQNNPQGPAGGEMFAPQGNPQMPANDQDNTQQSGKERKIPFMIKFDEFVNGQTYQGYTALAIRTYGTSSDEALLAEPVTNEIARLVGLPATQTAYTGFQFNDDDETLYVISELVNEEYLSKYFENGDGVLYKAEIGSTLRYEGEDPSSYAKSFTQQTRVNDADLSPLIDFMRFLDQSDDETFENELPNYLDVDAFATYLAVNDLLVNTDSVIGMNNNFYLYYDDVNKQFTLLMWDTNESLGKVGGNVSYSIDFINTQGNSGGQGGGGRGMMGGGKGPGGGQNTLLTRFMANTTFKSLYEEKLESVYQQAFLSGMIATTIEHYSSLIHSVNSERNLVDIDAYDQAVEKTLTFINQRMEYLANTDLLGRITFQN